MSSGMEPEKNGLTLRGGDEVRAEESRLRRFNPLRDLPPFAVAAVILYFVLAGRDWHKIALAIQNADLPLFIAGAALFTAGYFLTYCISYHQVYNWFLVRIRFTEMVRVFGGTLLPQTLVNALGQAVLYIYMIRKKRLKLWPVLSTSFFFIFNDLWVMVILLTTALILKPHMEPVVYLWYGILVPSVLALTWYFPGRLGKKLVPALYRSGAAMALRDARARHYVRFLPIRLVFPVFQVAGHLLALKAMGIEAPLGSVIVIVTAMTVTTFMPVSALGLGAPNLVAMYFAPFVADPEMAGEVAAAYGLLFQTCFLAGRLLIGLVFVGPFWREVSRAHVDVEHVNIRSQE